jgi:hypothetical protein
VRLVLDDPCGESFLEEVALPPVTPVKALRIQARESVHPCRDLASRCLDQDVVVRAHQTPGVQLPFERADCLHEQGVEPLSIEVVDEDKDPAGPA